MEDIEEELAKRKKYFCGNRVTEVPTLLSSILVRYYIMPPCVCECSSLALYEIYEKTKDYHRCYI